MAANHTPTASGPPVVPPHADASTNPARRSPPFVNPICVDSAEDADSAIGTDISGSNTSARSSIYDYFEENGRKYQKFKEGKYFLPNDEAEQDRLDLQHQLFLIGFHGKLYFAPLEEIPDGLHHVLDIGTGTGIWAIDFANAHPSANVIGTDLSPIQPEFVPQNCRFEVDDAEDQWVFNHPFEFIHGRLLASCFNSAIDVFRSAFNSLRPGGYLELHDSAAFASIDGSDKGTAFEKWKNNSLEGVKRLGRNFDRTPHYKSYLEEIGFVDIVEKRFAFPIGTWAKGAHMKTVGEWCKADFLAGMQGWSVMILTRGMGMTSQEVEVLLADVKNEINSGKLHVYMPIWVVYGRKPAV